MIKIDEKDLLKIADSIMEGAKAGVITDTLWLNGSNTTVVEFIVGDLLNMDLEEYFNKED